MAGEPTGTEPCATCGQTKVPDATPPKPMGWGTLGDILRGKKTAPKVSLPSNSPSADQMKQISEK